MSAHTLAICLLPFTSLPAWRSALVKVRDLTNCVHVLVHFKVRSLSFTHYLSCLFSFYQLSVGQNISSVSLVFPRSSLPSLVFPMHICLPTRLSQGDPASQSPLSVRLGPLLILLHLSCLSSLLWEEFMTVP